MSAYARQHDKARSLLGWRNRYDERVVGEGQLERGDVRQDLDRIDADRRIVDRHRRVRGTKADDYPVLAMQTLSPHDQLEGAVAALEQHPNARESDLVPHMKALFDGLELTAEQFFPIVYDLLIDRPKGPKLTTLVTVMGVARALPLLRASL